MLGSGTVFGMTILHNDYDNNAGSSEFTEPDATVMEVDCLCGNVKNQLNLTHTTLHERLAYTGVCEGCHREMELTISAKPSSRAEAVANAPA